MEPITMIALAAGGLYLLTRKGGPQPPKAAVTGSKTGKQWLTRIASVQGSGDDKIVTVEVYAPAGSYGPHHETLVTTYQQTGSDKGSRKVVSIDPRAIPQMVTDAGLDFAIKKS
ncbi:MAG: hypothetical protein ACPG77_03135 [Nannocystaceae bacterium]